MTMYFDSPGAFADHLQRILDGLPAIETAAMDRAAEDVQTDATAALETTAGSRAALGTPGPGTPVRARTLGSDDVQRSVRGRVAVVGVAEGPASDEAIDLEFGTPDNPPRSFLGQAGFVHGERAAAVAGEVMFRHLAGLPPLARKK